MRKGSRWLGFLVVLCCVMLLVGCGGSGAATPGGGSAPAAGPAPAPAPAKDTSPIKIGVLEPLSGAVAAAGQSVVAGAKLAVEFVNSQGGINGRRIELLIEDHKNDPAEAVNAATKLITRDKVPVLMGAWGSSVTLAVMPLLERNSVPMVVETSSASKITDGSNAWVFRIAATSDQEADGMQPFLQKLGVKKAAIIAVNNDWGRSGNAAYSRVLQAMGAQVVSTQFVQGDATDFYPQLTNIKSSGADWIIINSDVGQIALVVKQIKELGLPQKVLSAGGSNFSDGLIQLAGVKAAEGVYSAQHSVAWDPDHSSNPQVARMFLDGWKKSGQPWIGIKEGVRGFDGIITTAEALKKAAAIEPKAIQAALKDVTVNCVATQVKFDAKGQSPTVMYLTQVVDGKTKLVQLSDIK